MIRSHEPLPTNPSRQVYRVSQERPGWAAYVLQDEGGALMELHLRIDACRPLDEVERYLWLLLDSLPQRTTLRLVK